VLRKKLAGGSRGLCSKHTFNYRFLCIIVGVFEWRNVKLAWRFKTLRGWGGWGWGLEVHKSSGLKTNGRDCLKDMGVDRKMIKTFCLEYWTPDDGSDASFRVHNNEVFALKKAGYFTNSSFQSLCFCTVCDVPVFDALVSRIVRMLLIGPCFHSVENAERSL
jgi:hypothetical protein